MRKINLRKVNHLKLGLILSTLFACSANARKDEQTIEHVIVRVAQDVCTQEATQPNDPRWVALACQIDNSLVHIWLPQEAAQAVKQSPVSAQDVDADAKTSIDASQSSGE